MECLPRIRRQRSQARLRSGSTVVIANAFGEEREIYALGPASRGRGRVVFQLLESILDVMFPPRCVGCGDFESYLCPHCQKTLEEIGGECCPRCGEPGVALVSGGWCAACVGRESSLAGARAAFVHKGAARSLVSQFKSGRQLVLGRLMAELARPAFAEFLSFLGPRERVAITWVPCHTRTLRQRGYNQAEVLCRLLCEGPPRYAAAGLLRKVRVTRQQKELNRAARQRNLRGAFEMVANWQEYLPPTATSLVVVDDVFTTGATANEVAQVLAKATGLPVYMFTFSRAVLPVSEAHD